MELRDLSDPATQLENLEAERTDFVARSRGIHCLAYEPIECLPILTRLGDCSGQLSNHVRHRLQMDGVAEEVHAGCSELADQTRVQRHITRVVATEQQNVSVAQRPLRA